MASCVSVLRFGPFLEDSPCAVQLRSALLKHFANKQHGSQRRASSTTTAQQEKAQPGESNLIELSNKYFTAKVLLEEICTSSSSTTQSFAEDGLVLVFDSALSNPNIASSIPASFEAMEAIHNQAVSGDAPTPPGDLLRLCVGVGKNESLSSKEYEQQYSRRVLWCLDRGYEYVEADLSEEGISSGHDARDKEGFARIVEAIAGTVWSSAVMEKRAQSELKKSYAQDAAAATSTTAKEDDNINAYEPPDPSKLPPVLCNEKDEERERKAREALLATETSAANIDDDKIMNNDTVENKDEAEQERALNALEGSLREAGRIRELSKSGQLSDDERRKRAGDAAMLLMDMMGKMGFESSDDEGENIEGKLSN